MTYTDQSPDLKMPYSRHNAGAINKALNDGNDFVV